MKIGTWEILSIDTLYTYIQCCCTMEYLSVVALVRPADNVGLIECPWCCKSPSDMFMQLVRLLSL